MLIEAESIATATNFRHRMIAPMEVAEKGHPWPSPGVELEVTRPFDTAVVALLERCTRAGGGLCSNHVRLHG